VRRLEFAQELEFDIVAEFLWRFGIITDLPAPASLRLQQEDIVLIDVRADLYCERSSQKGIVIGHRGERLKKVGTNARVQIEALLGTPVYLDLHVKVAKDWQRDPKQLRRLGF